MNEKRRMLHSFRPVNICTLFFAILFLVHCSYTPQPIEEGETAEILRVLSSDEMMGRQAMSPQIRMAEDFIEDNFERSGLKNLNGLSSFRQEFALTEVSIETSEVRINNQVIPNSNFVGFINQEFVQLNSEQTSTARINENENFRSRFNELRNSEEDLVVFVPTLFENIFARYQSFYTRANRFLEGDLTGNVVFILTNENSPSFSIAIQTTAENKPLANVVGTIEGKRSDEYVIFSAHHDHIGIRTPVNADSIGNGANDNASGVTAVIQLAKYFSSLSKPERTLIFVTFTAEEIGGYGSQYFSRQMNPEQIIAMFNIEMIGKPAVSGPNTAWITGYDRSTFGELLSKSAEGTIYEFYPDPYPDQNLFFRSDNATLARLGVPAHTISTTPIDVDRDYHQVSDEFETINISHLNNTIKAIAKAAEGIITGRDTPTRVNTDLLN